MKEDHPMNAPRLAMTNVQAWVVVLTLPLLVAGQDQAPPTEPVPAASPQPPDPASAERVSEAYRLLQLAVDRGNQERDYPGALEAARAALKIFIEVHGEAHPMVASTHELIARIHDRNGDIPGEIEALGAYEKVLILLRGPDDWKVQNARLLREDRMRVAAMTPEERELIDQAARSYERALELARAGRIDEAFTPLEAAVEASRRALGEQHRDQAVYLELKTRLHAAQQKYDTARGSQEQALALYAAIQGERHPAYIAAVRQLAGVVEGQGDFVRSASLCERALALHREVLPEEAEERAGLMEHLALLLLVQGDHASARAQAAEAVAIREKIAQAELRRREGLGGLGFGRRRSAFGVPSPGLGMGGPRGSFLNSSRGTRDRPPPFGMGHILPEGFLNPSFFGPWQGDPMGSIFPGYSRDEPGGSDADVVAMSSSPTHPWTLRNRARMLLQRVDQQGGGLTGVLHAPGFEPDSRFMRGPGWIAFAHSLGRFADALAADGEVQQARIARLRSLEIGLEATDPNEETSAEYAGFVAEFAGLLQEFNELDLSRNLAEQSVVLRRDLPGEQHPDYAESLDRLATVLWLQGDHIAAMLLLERAFELRRLALGEGHPEVAETLHRLTLLHTERGDRPEARRQAGRALALYESFVRATLPFQPERQRLALLAHTARSLSAFLDLADRTPEQAEEAYRHLLAWKGIATEAAAAQRAAAATPELRALADELQQVRDELTRISHQWNGIGLPDLP
jgi:hypothetical protein